MRGVGASSCVNFLRPLVHPRTTAPRGGGSTVPALCHVPEEVVPLATAPDGTARHSLLLSVTVVSTPGTVLWALPSTASPFSSRRPALAHGIHSFISWNNSNMLISKISVRSLHYLEF